MNERTQLATSTMIPVLLITVYRNTSTVTGEGQYYLESHDVTKDGNVTAGKPLLQETIQEVVDVFFDERKNTARVKGMLPDNLLKFDSLPGGQTRLVWHRPAEIRVVHHAVQLKLKTEKCWVPAMIYVAEKNRMSVYAVKTNSRPTEKTKLYRAPFFNVDNGGLVCLGSATVKKPKDATFENLIKYWEDLFWLSEFSHVNGGEKVKKGKLQEVWKKLLASKTKLKWSDVDQLVAYGNNTLKNIL